MYSIIGGGICGLTTALAFEKLGIEYELYEKADELFPVGSGILLTPNALQVFEWLGILDELVDKGSSMERITLTNSNLFPLFDYMQNDVKEKFGYYSISIHRWELQNTLLQKLPKNKIKLGKTFIGFEQMQNQVKLLFKDKTEVRTDFIIGADGIHSTIRKQLFPEVKTRYSGQTCWRGICKHEELSKEYHNRGIEMWGHQARFGITKMDDESFYWFAVVLSTRNQKDIPGTTKGRLYRAFRDFHPVVRMLIAATIEKDIIRSDLIDIEPMRTWYKGNVCLLGDAAHATTPNMGQGGAQAIEDAYFLSNIIEDKKTVHIFEAFQKKRMKKVNLIVRQSRVMGIIGHWKYFAWLRNFMLTYMPWSIFKAQWRMIYKLR